MINSSSSPSKVLGGALAALVAVLALVASGIGLAPSALASPGGAEITSVVPGDGTLTVTWTAATPPQGDFVTGYRVEYTTGGSTVVDSPGTATNDIRMNLVNGTTYTITVISDYGVSTSESSAPTTGTPATSPGAPTGVVGTAGDSSASLSWTAPSSDGGSAITGYSITYTDTTTNVSGTYTPSGTGGSATVTGLTNGHVYTFAVAAQNAAGTGTASANSSAVIPNTAPGVPTSVAGVPGNASVVLTWAAPSNAGTAITSYLITSTDTSASNVTATYASAGTGVTTTIPGLTNGHVYTFTVAALNAAGSGTASASSAPVTPATMPGAPTAVLAVAGSGSATVSWTPPVVTGGSPITGYVLTYLDSTNSAGNGTFTPTGTAPTATVSGLHPGDVYAFRVSAINLLGSGPASAASAPVIPAALIPGVTAPGTPTGVAAVAASGAATVTWSAPVSDGGSALTGYVVVYTDSTDPAHSVIHHVGAGVLSDSAALVPGDHYTVTVAAVNLVSPGSLAVGSGPVVPFTIPGAPSDLMVTAGHSFVSLHWAEPAATGFTPITGYRVTVTDVTAGNARVLVTGRVLTTTVTGLVGGHRYGFAVVAVNAAGPSAGSAVAAVALPAPAPAPAPAPTPKPRGSVPPPAVSAAKRAHEIRVPADPRAYRGPVRFTTAYGRSQSGTMAFAVATLHGYQLHTGQAVVFSNGMFRPDSGKLTAGGRAEVRSLVQSLGHATALTCEGYTDYDVAAVHARTLSGRRAQAICSALKADGAHVRTVGVGYGGRRPVVVGGTMAARGQNRRVVIQITG